MSALSSVEAVSSPTSWAVRYRRDDGTTHEGRVDSYGSTHWRVLIDARRENAEWEANGWPVNAIDAIAPLEWNEERNAWLPGEWVTAAELDAEADQEALAEDAEYDGDHFPLTFRDVGVIP